MSWIKIEDRLPLRDEDVLAVNIFNEMQVCRIEKRWENEPEEWFTCNISTASFYPIYWMPLPSSPIRN